MIDKILNVFTEQKKYCIILGIIFVLLFGVGKVVPLVQDKVANRTPIVKIQAKCEKIYKPGSEINASDFKIYAIHQDGKESSLGKDDVKLSTTKLTPVGNITNVTVTLKDKPELQCAVAVKSERNKVLGFQCGYPKTKDVIAVLYDNGELCFEGTGDVLVFEDGEFPWNDYEEMDDYPIEAVSFQDTVKPTNMNYWFSGNDTLTYSAPIPASVKSMVETFKDCTLLKKTANINNCTELLNITGCYSGCEQLNQTTPIPPCVTTAVEAYSGCVELQVVPDMTNATGLQNMESMFSGCTKLSTASIPNNATNLNSTFSDCINLQDMPNIPATAIYMENTFDNAKSLTNLTSIPSTVQTISQCFNGCEMATGNLTIATSTEECDGLFAGAAVATKINLTGNSRYLDMYANTSDTSNVTVNGKAPNTQLQSASDYAMPEDAIK